MSTLYIDQQSARLQRDGAALAIYLAGKRHSSVPVRQLERLVMVGEVELSSTVLGFLAEEGVDVVMLSGRQNKLYAQVSGAAHRDAARRLVQYRCHQLEGWRDQVATRTIAAKLAQQIATLEAIVEQRPDHNRPLYETLTALREQQNRLVAPVLRPSLLGLEGAAAQRYFQTLTLIFPAAFGFERRERQPPPDPVNSLLSLGYSMLYTEAVAACRRAGLDPAFGFFHELSYGHEALASDLIEPLRPRYDQWVWRVLAEKRLRLHHFNTTPQGCFLGKEGRAIFFAAFEVWVRPMRRWLNRQSYQLLREMEEVANA